MHILYNVYYGTFTSLPVAPVELVQANDSSFFPPQIRKMTA